MSPRPSQRLRSPLRSAAAAAALAAIAGCGGGPTPSSGATPQGTPAGTAAVIPVTLSDAGCTPSNFSLHPGSIVFSVTNPASTKVEEMEVDDQQGHVRGDVEGVMPGQTRSFVVDLTAGVYEVRCPQQATTFGTLTIG